VGEGEKHDGQVDEGKDKEVSLEDMEGVKEDEKEKSDVKDEPR
jgi:hypothetical protein